MQLLDDVVRIVIGYLTRVDLFVASRVELIGRLSGYREAADERYTICRDAATEGSLGALALAREMRYPWGPDTPIAAAKRGDLECLTFAIDGGCPIIVGVWAAAAANGHIHILEYAHNHKRLDKKTHYCNAAARGGRLETVIWLHERAFAWDVSTYTSAAVGGHIHIISHLYNGCCPGPDIDELSYAAVDSGSVKLVQWLDERKLFTYVMSKTLPASAARRGHMFMLVFLYERGCSLDWVCASAIRGGFLNIFHWARKHGARYGKSCQAAASMGYLSLLKDMVADGAVISPSIAALEAARNGHVQVLMWLDHKYNKPRTSNIMGETAKEKHFLIVQYLCSHDIELNQSIFTDALTSPCGQRCGLPIIRFAIEKKILLPPGLCWKAAEVGCLHTIEYLNGIGYPWERTNAMEPAIDRHYYHIVDWISRQPLHCTTRCARGAEALSS